MLISFAGLFTSRRSRLSVNDNHNGLSLSVTMPVSAPAVRTR